MKDMTLQLQLILIFDRLNAFSVVLAMCVNQDLHVQLVSEVDRCPPADPIDVTNSYCRIIDPLHRIRLRLRSGDGRAFPVRQREVDHQGHHAADSYRVYHEPRHPARERSLVNELYDCNKLIGTYREPLYGMSTSATLVLQIFGTHEVPQGFYPKGKAAEFSCLSVRE